MCSSLPNNRSVRRHFITLSVVVMTLLFSSKHSALEFYVVGGGTYRVIFKSGDDLRQDQFVVQLIRLLDIVLRVSRSFPSDEFWRHALASIQREQLDLHLTPYAVLATSPNEGRWDSCRGSTVG